jgi:hypothetical protein
MRLSKVCSPGHAGPSPEIARIVRESDCGVIAPGFSARELAAALSGLSHTQISRFKCQSHSIARKLSAAPNKKLLIKLVANLLREPHVLAMPGGDRVE